MLLGDGLQGVSGDRNLVLGGAGGRLAGGRLAPLRHPEAETNAAVASRQAQRLTAYKAAVLVKAKRHQDVTGETHGGIHHAIVFTSQFGEATEQDRK